MATVILLGALDTKGIEYNYLRQRIQELDSKVILIDTGIKGRPQVQADISREQVAQAAGTTIAQLASTNDRIAAIEAMARGATTLVLELFTKGQMHGIFGLGGSGGSALITHVMRALPIGIPKLIVATIATDAPQPNVGDTDITMMYSVVDITGVNRISERILTNAAAGIAGMSQAYEIFKTTESM